MEDDVKTYKALLINAHGTDAPRFYSVFSSTPHIRSKGLQATDILRTVCYGNQKPFAHNGQETFEFSHKYYAFVGETTQRRGGTTRVEIRNRYEVHLGDAANNGSYLLAKCTDGYEIGPPDARTAPGPERSPSGTFTVLCVDQPGYKHNYVVGLAQDIKDNPVVLAAVAYNYQAEFVIQPTHSFLVRLQRGAVGDVVTDTSNSVKIVFRDNRTDVSVQEEPDGSFTSFDNSGTVFSSQTGRASHQPPPAFSTGPRAASSGPSPPPPPPPPPPQGAAPDDEDEDEPEQEEDPYDVLRGFDIVFVIDDSASMKGRSWRETRDVLRAITDICTNYDDDGVDIYFLNHRSEQLADQRNGRSSGGYLCVRKQEQVFHIFDTVQPKWATPLGRRLRNILQVYLKMYHENERRGMDSRPLSIIVITDGRPSDSVEDEIVWAARKLNDLDAPTNQVGIQFFQVGNPGAKASLDAIYKKIVEKKVRDIIDTVTWDAKDGKRHVLTSAGVLKTVTGAFRRRMEDTD
ncbi:von Willebrand factor, type A [Niveomyces insectorum RCEF 264]|uniref:von Willebrand factor, type A n=1 Tax=Niveomyces insectorum RCEF 264 TaxID=1081102 RepID=A0A167QGI6_9HYPO|nr:von Willebrand factor, type A [Niveomyces insectorum RCEF 264]